MNENTVPVRQDTARLVRGFTLLELLVVVGILAILATTVVLVLNPAEFLKQARDTQRISDLDTVKGAMALYLARATSADLDGPSYPTFVLPVTLGCGVNWWWSDTAASFPRNQPFRVPATAVASQVPANPKAIDGTGWVPVDFTNQTIFPSSTPISKLPVDPNPDTSLALAPQVAVTDATGRYYAYSCNDVAKTYEINASMESAKYSFQGIKDLESTDGGVFACSGPGVSAAVRCSSVGGVPKANFVYEVGNDPGLDL